MLWRTSRARLEPARPTGGLSQFEDLLQRLKDAEPADAIRQQADDYVDLPRPPPTASMRPGRLPGNPDLLQSCDHRTRQDGNQSPTAGQRPGKPPVLRLQGDCQAEITGKLFFFGDTHLSTSKADGFYELRKQQAEAIVSVIKQENTAGLPVLMTGDLNSSKWQKPSNAPYDVFTNELVDPLGNDYWEDFPSIGGHG